MRPGISRRKGDGFCSRGGHSDLHRPATGTTLVETMITAVVVVIASLGGLRYEYLSAKHTKIAVSQMTATRTGRLLLEDWKSTGGSSEYRPSSLGLGFSAISPFPSGFTIPAELNETVSDGAYSAKTDGLPMVVALRHKDVAVDLSADVKLRQLNIVVGFGEVVDGQLTQSAGWLGGIKTITLTTFVRTDASSG